MRKKSTIRLHFNLLTVLLLCTSLAAICQTTVSGIVTGAGGQPLSSVSVKLKGTSSGTTTDAAGHFSLRVGDPANSVLVFSYIEYEAQEISVSGQTTLAINLKEVAKGLQQVVVVGYGTQRRLNLTGSVSTLDTRDLTTRPITQTSQALQGKMAGVTVTQNFGVPGSDGGSIRIRGIGTLGNASPLVLIDGVEGAINDINPNDIENLSVLKDASSASIYGSRAANGVILITTKRGRKSEPMSVIYNGMYAWQSPTDLPESVDGLTFLNIRNESERNNGRPNLYPQAFIDNYKNNIGTEPNFNTDWFDLAVKKTAPEQLHNLTLRGGGEKLSALVSLSALDQNALISRTDFSRLSLRFNTNFQASKRLGFSMDGFLNKENANRPNLNGGINELFRMVTELPNFYPGLWADGTFGEGWNGANPYAIINSGGRLKSNFSRVQLNLRANYALFDWLKLEAAYAPKYLSTVSNASILTYPFKRIDGSMGVYPTGNNSLNNSNNRTTENFFQGLLRFNKTFSKHDISALVGTEYLVNRNENFSATRQNFLFPNYLVLSSGDANFQTNGGGASEWAIASYFGRINYALDNKYLFEANLRYDGSSRFARNQRWGVFPSFSAGWRISEENFMKSIGFLNDLKLRASWGQLGQQDIGNYPYLGVVDLNQPYYFGGTVAQGAAQTVLPNADVTWETTTVLNGGLDFGLFNNRLTGSLDIYKRNTKDILYKRDIPAIIGLSPSEQNIAEVENRGWDLQLSYRNDGKNFRYGIDGVFSDVRNKVINLNGKPQYGRNVIFEGEEYEAFFGYEATGIFRSTDDLSKYPQLNSNVKIGDLIYKDQNGDGKIDATNDKKIIGSNIPRYNYGATFNVGYKGLDLSVFLQGVGKKNLYYATRQAAYGGTYYTYQLNRFVPDDPSKHQTANWPRIAAGTSNDEDNSFFLYNAAFLRCKNITLSYTLSPSVLKHIKVSSLRLYASGTNLFTVDKLPINTIDPEAPSSTNSSSYYPNTKTISVGLDLRF